MPPEKLNSDTTQNQNKTFGDKYTYRFGKVMKNMHVVFGCYGDLQMRGGIQSNVTALQLEFLTQLSSLSVECLFSCLKLIQKHCDKIMKKDTTKLRLFLQRCGDMGYLSSSINKNEV